MIFYIPTILLVAASVVYLVIGGAVIIRRGWSNHTIRLLLFLLGTSAVWEMLHALWQLVRRSASFEGVLAQLPIYGVLLLAFLYFHLSQAFLHVEESDNSPWWRLGIVVMLGVLLVQGSTFLMVPLIPAGEFFSERLIGLGALIMGWVIFTGGVALGSLRSYRQAPGPLHRNRIKYWLLALVFFVGGDAFLFAGREILGSGLRLAAVLLITYAVTRYRLLDVSQITRRGLSYLIITLLTVILYLVGFIIMGFIFQVLLNTDPLIPALATALILAIFFNPFLGLVQRVVDRLVLGSSYNPNVLVRQYSATISNILGLKRLTTVAIGMIRQTMGIQYGALFLVFQQTNLEGLNYYQLQPVKARRGKGLRSVPSGQLQVQGLVATYLAKERQPLTQYDLDLHPRFEKMAMAERTWLSGLEMDVYVPIYAKNEWIGLLALGPKRARKSYFDNDLTLLSTLADQTAVALQNARLVEDLVRLNKDLKQAYGDLDRANQQLKELDNLKSSFIGVITHELRSPFINIDFSLQLIERYGIKHLVPEQREQLEQLKSNVEKSKQMVDNLVGFATFLSKRGELFITKLDVHQVIEEAVVPARPMAAQKQLELTIDIPPDLPAISGDAQRITDAVYQLVHNGVKFTPTGGQIWIRCRVCSDDAVCFEVQDTGAGVPSDKLPSLWEEFAQMSDSLLRGVEGLGLGLTLVQYVARAHGGDVFAQSKVEVGSTFGFKIPADR